MSGIYEQIRRRIARGDTNTVIARALGVEWWIVAHQREKLSSPLSTALEVGDRVLYREQFCRVVDVLKRGVTIDCDGRMVYANFGQVSYQPTPEEIAERKAVLNEAAMAATRDTG
jgi:hypothetical protein